MKQTASITTRPLLPTDEAFAYQVYAGTRLDELAPIPWTQEQKDAFVRMQYELRQRQYRLEYPEAVTEMILCEDVPAGSLITLKTAEAIRLVDIAFLAEFRRAGIGAAILRRLQEQGKKIVLHVLRQNPAARLYSRLGFACVAEDAMYLRMEWNPP